MRVVIGSDAAGMPLKELIKETLLEDGHEVVDLSVEPAADFVDSATAVAADLMENEGSQGLCFDAYGVGSYMAATRVKGMVAANISDERSAYMTASTTTPASSAWAPPWWAPRSPRRSPASSSRPITPPVVTRCASTCSTRWPRGNES